MLPGKVWGRAMLFAVADVLVKRCREILYLFCGYFSAVSNSKRTFKMVNS